MSFAIGPPQDTEWPERNNIGSRNKLSRNGSTASSESARRAEQDNPDSLPPSHATSSIQRFFQALQVVAQCGGARATSDNKQENPQAKKVRRELRCPNSSCRLRFPTQDFEITTHGFQPVWASRSKVIKPNIASQKIAIHSTSWDRGPIRVRHDNGLAMLRAPHRIEPKTSGTSMNAKIPNSALNSARRSGSSPMCAAEDRNVEQQSTNVEVRRRPTSTKCPKPGAPDGTSDKNNRG